MTPVSGGPFGGAQPCAWRPWFLTYRVNRCLQSLKGMRVGDIHCKLEPIVCRMLAACREATAALAMTAGG